MVFLFFSFIFFLFFSFIFLLSSATRAGSLKQHMPINVGSYCLEMLILVREGNRYPEKNPRSTGEINYGNSTYIKYKTRFGFSGERHNALTACATRAFKWFGGLRYDSSFNWWNIWYSLEIYIVKLYYISWVILYICNEEMRCGF